MKNIVITGAGGVLCSAFAKFLAEKGNNIALLDINFDSANKVAEQINKNGGSAKAYKTNVLDKENLNGVHKQVLKDFGKCDILINGAGGNSPKCTTTNEIFEKNFENDDENITFFDLDKAGFQFVFDLNILGTVLTTQVFAPDMIGKKGCNILNISSMNAYRPLTKIPAYSAAKAGVSNLTQWLATHFAKENIRVNAIAPGFFVTNQNKALLFDENGNATKRTQKILNATPMGRFGDEKELLGALEFLTDSEKSSFITGVILPIDGGFSAYSGV